MRASAGPPQLDRDSLLFLAACRTSAVDLRTYIRSNRDLYRDCIASLVRFFTEAHSACAEVRLLAWALWTIVSSSYRTVESMLAVADATRALNVDAIAPPIDWELVDATYAHVMRVSRKRKHAVDL